MEIIFSTEDVKKIVEAYVRMNLSFAAEDKAVRVEIDKYGYNSLVKAVIEEKETA